MRSQRSILKSSPSPAAAVRRDTPQSQANASYLDFDNDDSRVAGAYKMLSETGRLEQIRAQLRREIFTHLLDSKKSASAVDIDLMTSTPGRLSLALVASFVRSHFPATFSVFMAEANLAWLPVEDNDALLLTRLGISLNLHKKENVDTSRSSALELIVQHLLQLKLDVTPKGDADKPKYLAASWQPCSERKLPISTSHQTSIDNNNNMSVPTRSVESILSDMRTLIREELSLQPKPQQKQPQQHANTLILPPHEEQLRQHVNTSVPLNTRNQQKPTLVPIAVSNAGLDENRLHEYIEKMVERMMGSRHGEIAVGNETKTTTQIKRSSDSKASKMSPKTTAVHEKKLIKGTSTSQNKKQLSFRESPSSNKKQQSPSTKTAGKTILAANSAASTILAVEEIRRHMSTSPPATRMEKPLRNDTVSDVFELRRRLDVLEQEAEKLESTCHQRLAALDNTKSLAHTFNLIDRISSNRRSFTGVSETAILRPSSSTFVQPPRAASSICCRPSSASFGVHSTSFLSTSCVHNTRRQSPTICRPLLGSTLPASSKVRAMIKRTLPINEDPYNCKEYSQSQNLLTSVPSADHRWVNETGLLSAGVKMPTPTVVPHFEPQQNQAPLPFSVFPSGISPQSQKIEQTVQQSLPNKAKSITSTLPHLVVQSNVSRRDEEGGDYEERKLEEMRPKNEQSTDSDQVEHHFQHVPASFASAAAQPTVSSKFQEESPASVHVMGASTFPADSPPRSREDHSPPAYSVPDASPELNKIDYTTDLSHNEELQLPSQQQQVVILSDMDSVKVEANEATTAVPGDDVDDVLKKYMEMVLQQRAAVDSSSKAATTTTTTTPSHSATYDHRNYEEEEERPTLFTDRSRPKIISGKGRQNDDPPSASEDFWS